MKEEQVMEFLTIGFQQFNRKISLEEMKEVAENFDGIIGWATQYGWLRSKNISHEAAIREVKEHGTKVLKSELLLFLEGRKAKDKYLIVLQSISKGHNSWSIMKNYLVQKKMNITNHQLTFYLQELQDYGFIEKTEKGYYIIDPIFLRAMKE